MKSFGLGLLVFLAISQARAQDSAYTGQDNFKDQPVDDNPLSLNVIPTMRRWSIHGLLGFQFDSSSTIKNSWTYSMIESPIFGLGARFRVNPTSWHHFNMYARADLVYLQKQWDIQTAFGTSSLTERLMVVRPYFEMSYHPHFAHWLTVFLALGVQSPPVYKSFSLSNRGYSTELRSSEDWTAATQLNFGYMAGGGLLVTLGYDMSFAYQSSRSNNSAIVGGISYGF
jgi:hypothetical protein